MNKEQDEGFAWQVGVWNSMADTYQQEIDRRFGSVIEEVLVRAKKPAPRPKKAGGEHWPTCSNPQNPPDKSNTINARAI